jgi:hypothetical protein
MDFFRKGTGSQPSPSRESDFSQGFEMGTESMFHKKYLTLSIFLHAMFVLILLQAYSSSGRDMPLQVIEVSIVNGISSGGSDGMKSGSIRQARNAIVNDISLSEVEKEKPVPVSDPDLLSSEINAPSTGRDGQTGFMEEAKGSGRFPKGAPYEINQWRSRVQGIVVSSMQKPVAKNAASLQTTCLLMVSRSGELLRQQLVKSSGNDLFDSQVKASLGKVGHLPPPPLVLIAGAESIDVMMSFTTP